ncbi:MAG: DUF2461 domain-containing protein [Burkholderiaceae bacterium]|nr:DUF2461 domain-containing protein [Microbacteriaceae bacterium]
MTFIGFTHDASDFLSALADDNSRDYFDAHRNVYIDSIRQPLEDLLGEAETIYGPGRVMRPNRDVRFSANKAPYKTSASLWAGTVGGVYLSLSATHMDVGGGIYGPSRDQLERARTAVDAHPQTAAQLSEIVDVLVDAGFEIAGPSLKTAPRGYDRDHPAIELLRLKHFAALKSLPITASPDTIRSCWTAVEPLIAWGNTFVKAPLSWP